MKVLFLDINGVLDNATIEWHPDPARCLDREAVRRLNRVVVATGCRVVLSSDWRKLPGLDRTWSALRDCGGTFDLHDATPVLTDAQRVGRWGGHGGNYTPRWMECQWWLDEHPEVSCYAVVDDLADFDADGWREVRVQTDGDIGLTETDCSRLVELLGGV